MAITKLNSLAIPAGTVEPADISYPLTNFSSTGIDDNANANAITIDSSENVGVGTTSPTLNASWKTLYIDNTTDSYDSRLVLRGGGSNKNSLILTSGTYNANATSFPATIQFTNSLRFFSVTDENEAGAAERMRIHTNGNIGIGTTGPAHELHIAGTEPNIRLDQSSGTASTLYGFEIASGSAIDGYFRSRGGTGETQIGSGRSSGWGGHLTFYTDTTERMRIDSSGYVTKPNTPAFSYGAYTTYDVSGTGTQTVSTSTVWNNSSYVNLNYNNGSHFNASTGRFTAPVAGIYRFDWRCGLADHSSGYFWWYIYKNSTAIAYWQSSQGMSSGSDDIALASMHVYVNLAANDYVEVKWANNYVSGTVYYPHFSGALVA